MKSAFFKNPGLVRKEKFRYTGANITVPLTREVFWMEKKNWMSGLLSERRVGIACCVLLGLTLLPMAVLSVYNHPCSDDYNYGLYVAQAVREGGSLWDVLAAAARKTAEIYTSWQGTFSAVFLMALQPAAFGESFYALTPWLMVGSLVFSTFFFLKEVCVRRLGMSTWAWVMVSCALSFFMVHLAHDPFEGFFWYNGSLFYTFFHSVMLCALTFALKFLRAPTLGRSLACALIAGGLCFFVGGGNYPTALLTCVLLLGGFLWTLWKHLPLSRRLGSLLFFLLELTAFGISILAPGNSVRQSHFESHPGAVKSILLALGTAVRNITEWTTLPLLLALLFLCPLFCKCAKKLSFRFPLPGLAPVAAVCLLGVLMTPPIYAMTNTGAGRTQDLYYDAFCLLAAGVVFYLCGWLTHLPAAKHAPQKAREISAAFFLSVALFFVLSVCCTERFVDLTGVSALRSLISREAQAYDAQVDAQVALLEDPSLTDVVLEPVTYRPDLLMPEAVPMLSEDPENQVNQRVATFYEKDSVRVSAGNP